VRRIILAAIIGLMATGTAAYAQSRSSASMMVSVRVIRSCVVSVSPSNPEAPSVTAQCSSSARPRAEMTTVASGPAKAPEAVARLADASPLPAPAADAVADAAAAATPEADTVLPDGFRVLTVNF
jgi:hypothetical protein